MSVTPGSVWYAPASDRDGWNFVVARSFLATVNSGASNAVLAALWALADADDVAVEDLVGAIPMSAESAVHSFALVSFPPAADKQAKDRVVTAVVRGAAVVDLFSVGGSRRFGAGGMEPWMLADFRSVTAIVLSGDDQPTAPIPDAGTGSLPVASGIVHAPRLLWTLATVDFSDDAEDLDATIITSREHPRARPAAKSPEHSAEPQPLSLLDDETVLLSRAGSRSRPVTRDRNATEPAQPEFRFRIAPGEPQSLDAPTVVGRNPSAPRVVGGRAPRLVQVDSPDAAVSSTHLRLVASGGAVVATDLRSTNGTLVTPLGGKRRRLRPGESLVVLAGTRIDIGDGNIIEIMSAEHALGLTQSPEPGKGPA